MSERIIHTVDQGSQEWLDLRAKHHTASNANALFNNRAALFEPEEHSDYVKNVIFPNGHRVESIAREYAQKRGISIEPCVMSRGKLLASLDGLKRDFMGNELGVWECKQWNAALAESVKNGIVPETHRWQLVHQLYVTCLKTATFVVTDGTLDKWVECEFTATQADFDKLLAAWDLFEKDLAAYVPAEKINAVNVAEPELNFLVPAIEVRGELITKDCADKILEAANEIKSRFGSFIISDTNSFSFSQKLCKELKKFEDLAKQEAENAFASVSDIEKAVKTYREAGEVARKLRLDTEKLSKSFEQNFNTTRILSARNQLAVYQASFPRITHWQPYHEDFEGVVKGMRSTSFDQKQAKWDAELARLKLEINQQVENYNANQFMLAQFEQYREGWGYDYQNHLTRPPVEFLAEMEQRVAALKAKKERERIEGLQREIAEIAAYPLSMRGVSDDGLKDKSAELQGFDTAPFGDLENSVKYAIDATVIAINAELTRRAEAEKQRIAKIEADKQAAIEAEKVSQEQLAEYNRIQKEKAAEAIFIPVITPPSPPVKPTLTDNQRAFLCDISAVVQKHTGADEATAKRRVNSIIDHLLNILE